MRRKHIPCFAPVFTHEERSAIIEHVANTPYLTSAGEVHKFEREFAKSINLPFAVMVNSGSTSLLVAMLAMRWKAGDKIIIPACNFPSAVSICHWLKLTPVFVDCELGTYNPTPQMIEDAKRKVFGVQGMVLVHNLGNPLDPDVWPIAGLTVEDSCDALGSTINGKPCGSFGLVSAHSFYPAHAITTIEGGMVATQSAPIFEHMRSIVNWGRDCKCYPGEDSRCGNRFGFEVDGVPYDHRYITSEAGGNFKVLELQGIIGSIQLKKLPQFVDARKRNFSIIYEHLEDLQDDIPLPISQGDPSWFAFPITLSKRMDRADLIRRIEAKGIQTRLLFAGNVTRHPFMKQSDCYIPYPLTNSDTVMERTVLVGCNQSITEEEAHYIGQTVHDEVTK